MSELSDLTSKEDLRKYALDYIEKTFREKLDAFTGDDKDREVSEDVKAKFEQTFHNFLSTGFDTVFKKELQDNQEGSAEHRENQKDNEEDQNLSVNDQQLQEMDDAVNATCLKRKFEPAKCSLFLDKTLKLQLNAATKIQSKVRDVETIKDIPAALAQKDLDNTNDDITDQVKDLKSAARARDYKALKIEKTAHMVMDVRNQKLDS